MLTRFLLTAMFFLSIYSSLFAQLILGDCTIQYTVTYKDRDSLIVSALKTVYIHGTQVRSDFVFSQNNYLQTILQDKNSGNVNILKEVGDNKYKTTLDSTEWRIHNVLYNNMKTVIDANEVHVILGYRCGKAMQTLDNGAKYYVYYTLDVVPSRKENDYQFKDIPGIVLQYESVEESNVNPIVIKAKNINLMPISDHLFKVPSKGYKISSDF